MIRKSLVLKYERKMQMNKIPTWIPDLIFKYQNKIFTWSGSSSYVTNPVYTITQ
jgi:hypothetical protein